MNKLKLRWNVTSNWQLIIIFIVFAITGSTAAYLSKPITNYLGVTKETMSLWGYWPIRILILFPIYQVMLVLIGALLGQFKFFWEFEKKMLNRLKLGSFSNYIDSKLNKKDTSK
jgi:hypothetical protein